MHPKNVARYIQELMRPDEIRAFVAGDDQQRKEMAVATLDQHLRKVRDAMLDDPHWPAAVRQICLDFVSQSQVGPPQKDRFLIPPYSMSG
jgi:hypothetical protein